MVAYFNDQFWWIVIGQTICGLSSPLSTGAISIIANLWFGDQERGKATSIMTASNPLGIFISFGIQAIYSVKNSNDYKAIPV